MTDLIATQWPRLIDFMYVYGRLAVQPFLVIAGFLAAQSLGKRPDQSLGTLIWKRYVRLAPPLLLALLMVVLATLCFGSVLFDQDWLSPLPSMVVVLAHILLLQDVLGIPSLSAGAWYVGIDFQLYVLMALLAHWSLRSGRPFPQTAAPLIVSVCTMASIVRFNHDPDLDVWAVYFMSAYGLGALAAWARQSTRVRWLFGLTVLVLLIDWWFDPRVRLLLVLVTAVILLSGSHIQWSRATQTLRNVFEYLSDVSYGLFVSHFAVIIVASGLWKMYFFDSLQAALGFFFLTWIAAIATGVMVQAAADFAIKTILGRPWQG